jgi:hypothetical protein
MLFSSKLLPPVVSVPRIPNCQHNFPTVEHFDFLVRGRNTIQWNSKQFAKHDALVATNTQSQWAKWNSKINNIGLIAVSITCPLRGV